MSRYNEGVPKPLSAVMRNAAHASGKGRLVGRSRTLWPVHATVHRGGIHRLPVVLVARLFFLLCLAVSSFFGPVARAATCPAAGAIPSAPPVTFLRSYRVSFNSPARLAVDADDQIYIADPVKGRIVVRDVDGRVAHEQRDLGFPNSVAVDGQGRIYVGDKTAGNVTVYARDWEPLFMLGQGDGEFMQPGDIAFDPATGNAYVTDTNAHRVNVYDPDGEWLRSFGEAGYRDGQFSSPGGLFVTADAVLVADQGNRRIQRFDLDGNFCAALGRRSLNHPYGIWVDGSGRILVADAFQGHVVVLDHDGNELGLISEFGHARGKLSTPLDLAMDTRGRLFVSSANGARVDIFGVSTYTDPERYVPATVQIAPGQLDRGQAGGTVTGLIEVPGYPLTQLVASSVTANDVPATAVPLLIGDNNHNGKPDVLVNFDGDALLATLPTAEQTTVTVRGSMGNMQFAADDVVAVVHTEADDDAGGDIPDADDDADGVANDQDACPGGDGQQPVDASGCSIAQYCPATGPVAGGTWRDHGRYVACVRQRVRLFVRARLITARQGRAQVAAARASGTRRGANVAASRAGPVGTVVGGALRQASSNPPPRAPAVVAKQTAGEVVQTGGVLQDILAYFGFQLERGPGDLVADDAVEQSTAIPTNNDKRHAALDQDSEKTEQAAREETQAAADDTAANDPVTADTSEPTEPEPPVPDRDRDGVSDYADMCPGSDAQDAVDTNGCSVAQLCPCDGRPTDRSWRSHRQYVACVTDNTQTFAAMGLLSERHRTDLVADAAASSCGAANRRAASDQRNRDGEHQLAMRRAGVSNNAGGAK